MTEQFNWNDIKAKNNNEDFPELTFVKFDAEKNDLTITFKTDTPISAKINKLNRMGYIFPVSDKSGFPNLAFYTSSIRVMQKLRDLSPIQGKTMHIIRSGTGKETTYNIEVV